MPVRHCVEEAQFRIMVKSIQLIATFLPNAGIPHWPFKPIVKILDFYNFLAKLPLPEQQLGEQFLGISATVVHTVKMRIKRVNTRLLKGTLK